MRVHLFHADGLSIDAVPNATYDIVYSANLLQRIPIHALRYKYLEEFFRVLKCDGHVSLQMGFGEGGAEYHDDHLTTVSEVSVTNATFLLEDLYKVGFRDPKHEIAERAPVTFSHADGRRPEAVPGWDHGDHDGRSNLRSKRAGRGATSILWSTTSPLLRKVSGGGSEPRRIVGEAKLRTRGRR